MLLPTAPPGQGSVLSKLPSSLLNVLPEWEFPEGYYQNPVCHIFGYWHRHIDQIQASWTKRTRIQPYRLCFSALHRHQSWLRLLSTAIQKPTDWIETTYWLDWTRGEPQFEAQRRSPAKHSAGSGETGTIVTGPACVLAETKLEPSSGAMRRALLGQRPHKWQAGRKRKLQCFLSSSSCLPLLLIKPGAERTRKSGDKIILFSEVLLPAWQSSSQKSQNEAEK